MKIIGISGVATSGKDTIYETLAGVFPQHTFARASIGDLIRLDVAPFLLQRFNTSVWDITPEQKESIRPLLAWYGDYQRKLTKGRYFIDQLEHKLKTNPMYGSVDYVVVPDIRFKEFEFDEVDWIKQHNGVLIHVSRLLPLGGLVQPANKLEEVNDPIIQQLADVSIHWNTVTDVTNSDYISDQVLKNLGPVLQRMIQTNHTEV